MGGTNGGRGDAQALPERSFRTAVAAAAEPVDREGNRGMKVGLFLNTQFPEGTSVQERVPEMVEQVRVARDAGFRSLWFPHHWLTQPMQMLQITPMMAYIAAHAQGMTIGPNILILPPLN